MSFEDIVFKRQVRSTREALLPLGSMSGSLHGRDLGSWSSAKALLNSKGNFYPLYLGKQHNMGHLWSKY
jgi:hypothetical protein